MRSISFEIGLYIPYFLLLAFILFLSLLYKKENFKLKFISEFLIILVLTLFIGLKPPFSWDLKNYCGMFQDINSGYTVVIEPFFIFSSKIFGILFKNCLAIFLWYALLTAFFIHLAIKKFSVNYSFSMLIFICSPFLFLNAFGVELRQTLAVVLFFYASLKLIFENSVKTYFIFTVLLTSIHFSAVFASLLLLLLYKINFFKNRHVIFMLFIFSVLGLVEHALITQILSSIYFKLISILNFPFLQKYANYFLNTEPINWLKYIFYNVLGLFHLLLLFRIKKLNIGEEKYIILIKLFIFGVILINIFSFSGPLSRIAFYFQVFQIITIPYIIKKIKPKEVVFIGIVYIYLLQLIVGLNYISPSGYKIFLPYRGYLGGNYEVYSE